MSSAKQHYTIPPSAWVISKKSGFLPQSKIIHVYFPTADSKLPIWLSSFIIIHLCTRFGVHWCPSPAHIGQKLRNTPWTGRHSIAMLYGWVWERMVCECVMDWQPVWLLRVFVYKVGKMINEWDWLDPKMSWSLQSKLLFFQSLLLHHHKPHCHIAKWTSEYFMLASIYQMNESKYNRWVPILMQCSSFVMAWMWVTITYHAKGITVCAHFKILCDCITVYGCVRLLLLNNSIEVTAISRPMDKL